MLKRVYIICEGETEQEFCTDILSKHFQKSNISIFAPVIKKSMGGIVKWNDLKKQIENTLKSDKTSFVTTLIDYFGIYSKHNFPCWAQAEKEKNKYKRMDILEEGMSKEIDKNLRHRFIPYIQLHEFESLLFIDKKYFVQTFPKNDIVGMNELEKTFHDFDNPEMINNNPETAPSKRLKKIVKGYNKIVHGIILAEAIGLNNIRSKSIRFDNWIRKLENL